ncbi:MAG: DUF4278 domain-containing protein [Synechocystis sp.]
MEFSFLLPLGIGLIVGYKSLGSNHDIAHIVAVFAVINLLISLLLAPWEIQIILLVVVAIAVRLLWIKFESKGESDSSAALADSQLSKLQYRGIGYQAPETSDVSEKKASQEKVVKCYRGINYQSPESSAAAPPELPKTVIKYRGKEVKQ